MTEKDPKRAKGINQYFLKEAVKMARDMENKKLLEEQANEVAGGLLVQSTSPPEPIDYCARGPKNV